MLTWLRRLVRRPWAPPPPPPVPDPGARDQELAILRHAVAHEAVRLRLLQRQIRGLHSARPKGHPPP